MDTRRCFGVRILPSRRLRSIVRVVALLLLFAQLGAELHAYSHLTNHQLAVPGSVDSCGTCVSSAPLLTAVGGGTQWVVLVRRWDAVRIAVTDRVSIAYRRPYPAFRSRAPPELS